MALLDRAPRTATVTAAGTVEALVMNAQEFASLLTEPTVSESVHRVAEQRAGELVAA
jgi:CRP-like cAMP-binding protein